MTKQIWTMCMAAALCALDPVPLACADGTVQDAANHDSLGASQRAPSCQAAQPITEHQQIPQTGGAQLSGTVLGLATVPFPGTHVRNELVIVDVDGQLRVVIDLGPLKQLHGIAFTPGQRISVQGSQISGPVILLAQRVKSNGQTIRIDRTAEMLQLRENYEREQRQHIQPSLRQHRLTSNVGRALRGALASD